MKSSSRCGYRRGEDAGRVGVVGGAGRAGVGRRRRRGGGDAYGAAGETRRGHLESIGRRAIARARPPRRRGTRRARRRSCRARRRAHARRRRRPPGRRARWWARAAWFERRSFCSSSPGPWGYRTRRTKIFARVSSAEGTSGTISARVTMAAARACFAPDVAAGLAALRPRWCGVSRASPASRSAARASTSARAGSAPHRGHHLRPRRHAVADDAGRWRRTSVRGVLPGAHPRVPRLRGRQRVHEGCAFRAHRGGGAGERATLPSSFALAHRGRVPSGDRCGSRSGRDRRRRARVPSRIPARGAAAQAHLFPAPPAPRRSGRTTRTRSSAPSPTGWAARRVPAWVRADFEARRRESGRGGGAARRRRAEARPVPVRGGDEEDGADKNKRRSRFRTRAPGCTWATTP